MKFISKLLPGGLTFFLPLLAFAQFDDIEDSLGSIEGILNTLTGIAVILALMYFFYNLGKWILNPDGEGAKEAKKSAGIGVIALAIIFSIWGIIILIQDAVGVGDDNDTLTPPSVEIR